MLGNTLAANVDELAVLIGLVLLAVGFWEFWRPGAYLVPGVVLLWLFVPQRERFLRPRALPPRRRKDAV